MLSGLDDRGLNAIRCYTVFGNSTSMSLRCHSAGCSVAAMQCLRICAVIVRIRGEVASYSSIRRFRWYEG